jgi:hypothetical protein
MDPRKTLMITSFCVSPTPFHINVPQKLMRLKLHNLMVLKLNSTNWLILLELMYRQPLEEQKKPNWIVLCNQSDLMSLDWNDHEFLPF